MAGSFGKFDDSDFQEFVSMFNDSVEGEQFLRDIEAGFTKVTGLALNIVKKKTPVGKTQAYTMPVLSGYTIVDKQFKTKGHGALRRAWEASDIQRSGNNLMVEIFNNEEYAIYVENGHRQKPGRYVPVLGKQLKANWVPGQHMLEKSLDEIQKVLDKVIGEAFEKAMKRLLEG
ncbi:HK97 gp10 family phage protein [Enterococcus olivae]